MVYKTDPFVPDLTTFDAKVRKTKLKISIADTFSHEIWQTIKSFIYLKLV